MIDKGWSFCREILEIADLSITKASASCRAYYYLIVMDLPSHCQFTFPSPSSISFRLYSFVWSFSW